MLNINDIKELIKAIDESKLDEFTYESNGTLITLKKSETIKETVSYIEQEPKQVVTQDIAQERQAQVAQPVQQVEEENLVQQEQAAFDYEIVSPMVGTVYLAPTPESDSYVSTGSIIGNDSIVCIVEAMKLFNEIEAEVSGEIVEVLVENGELVEFGQPLFRVKTK